MRLVHAAFFGLVALTSLAAACSAASSGSPATDEGVGGTGSQAAQSSTGASVGSTTTTASSVGAGGSFFDGGTTGSGGGMPGGCTEESTLMYLVGSGKEFYSFEPSKTLLKQIGVLNCSAGVANPFSMSVDRKGVAWVLYDSGQLFNVNIKDATCTPSGYLPGQQGFSTFGMGFVADAPGSDKETLFVTEADIFGNGTRLATIDTMALKLKIIGPYSGGLTGGADATGTGDGKLYGFFRTAPVTVAEIDKTNAAIGATGHPTVAIGAAWAFSFWGGSFWLFTSPTGFGSALDQFDMANGTTTNVSSNIGFTVVGAGVSTCAPIAPPK